MHLRRAATLFVMFLIALTATRAGAQPLADRVPGGAMLYVGWAGADSPNTGYAGSHLEAVMKDINFKTLFDQVMPQIMAKTNATPEDQKNFDAAMSIGGPFWRHPTALFLEPVDDANAESPVRGGVICQAGAEAKDLAKNIRDALAKDADAAKEFQVVENGDTVAIVFGYGNAKPQLRTPGAADALAKAQPFVAAMKQTVANPVFSIYIDVDRGLELLGKRLATNEEVKTIWPRIRDAAGFNGLHRIVVGGRFEGTDFSTGTFVDAPAPRKGLVKLFEGRPVEPEILKSIPQAAGSAQMARFDIAALVKEIRNVVAAADEGAAQTFDQGVGAVQMSIGKNPITDILEPLGDTWVMYSDQAVAGNAPQGIIITNKLDDPTKANQGLAALWIAATNAANPQMQRAGSPIRFQQGKVGDLTIYSVVTPTLTPGFTISNGKLIIGLSLDAISKAAKAQAPAAGLDQNEKFAAIQKRIAPGAPMTSFRFADLPQTAPAMYQQYEQGLVTLRALAQQEGIQLPEKLLPSLDVIQANLAPAGEISWTDGAGFHSRGVSPFPGSELFSNAPNGTMTQVGTSSMLVAVLLPSLNRARETANRVKCASNMRQIGQGILLYGNEHQAQYPPDLATLAREEELGPEVFICPSGRKSVPAGAAGFTKDQLADWIAKNTDYIYIGAGKNTNTAPADEVVLYENPQDHSSSNAGVNALFGDGHVEFLLTSEAQQRVPNFKAPGR